MNEKKAPDALSVRLDGTAHELTGDNIRAYLSGTGLAALAAVTGGDDMRRYCEYLKLDDMEPGKNPRLCSFPPPCEAG